MTSASCLVQYTVTGTGTPKHTAFMDMNFVVRTRHAKGRMSELLVLHKADTQAAGQKLPHFFVYSKAVRGYNAVVLRIPYQDLLRNVVLTRRMKWFV